MVRGGNALLRKRNNLAAAGLTKDQRRQEWESARLSHEVPGSHPAPRPDGLTGSRQATRQPKTVRDRRLDRTASC